GTGERPALPVGRFLGAGAGAGARAGAGGLVVLVPVAGRRALVTSAWSAAVAGLLAAVAGCLPAVAGALAAVARLLVAVVAVTGLLTAGLRGHEHRDGVRGDGDRAGRGIPGRALDHLVGAVGLDLVQLVLETGHAVDRLGDRLVGGVEHGDQTVERGVRVLAD